MSVNDECTSPLLLAGRSWMLPESVEALITLAQLVDLDTLTIDQVHLSYADWARKNGLSTTTGIVGTPAGIAKMMVALVESQLGRPSCDVRWLDPCSGSGVFTEAILSRVETEQPTYTDLPDVTAFELTPEGAFCTIVLVRKLLSRWGLSVDGYVASGRFRVRCEDFLTAFGEQQALGQWDETPFDAVVANPPYVRSTRMSLDYKAFLKLRFPIAFSGGADLYFFFLVAGLSALLEDGVLCYISPANFFRSVSARNLRRFVSKTGTVESVVDLDELPVFPGISVHTAIYSIRRGSKPGNDHVAYAQLESREQLAALQSGVVSFENVSARGVRETGWVLNTAAPGVPDIATLGNTIPLCEAGYSILSGVRPGVSAAFVYTDKQLDSLPRDIVLRWFKPCIAGRRITKWQTQSHGHWILMLTKESPPPPAEVLELLEPYRERLQNRPEVAAGGKWYALRSCTYYAAFTEERIAFPDIQARQRFCLEHDETIPLDGVYTIPGGDLVLLGILNSSLAWDYFTRHCSSIGNAQNRGRRRLKKAHVAHIPLPATLNHPSPQRASVERVVEEILRSGETDQLLMELDAAVHALYRGQE